MVLSTLTICCHWNPNKQQHYFTPGLLPGPIDDRNTFWLQTAEAFLQGGAADSVVWIQFFFLLTHVKNNVCFIHVVNIYSLFFSNCFLIFWFLPFSEAEEYSRPAVIGHAGSFGSYPGSAEAIKDILVSVLNASGLQPSVAPEQTTMQAAEHLDSDVDRWEESSDGDSHDGSDPAQHSPACTQTDIRFTRHRACWDNTDLQASKLSPDPCCCPHYSDADPATSSLNGFTLSDVSPLKQNCFTQVTLTGGTVTSAVVHPGKELYTSTEQDLTFSSFLSNSTAGRADVLKYPDALDPAPISNNDSNSPNGLSQSETANQAGNFTGPFLV